MAGAGARCRLGQSRRARARADQEMSIREPLARFQECRVRRSARRRRPLRRLASPMACSARRCADAAARSASRTRCPASSAASKTTAAGSDTKPAPGIRNGFCETRCRDAQIKDSSYIVCRPVHQLAARSQYQVAAGLGCTSLVLFLAVRFAGEPGGALSYASRRSRGFALADGVRPRSSFDRCTGCRAPAPPGATVSGKDPRETCGSAPPRLLRGRLRVGIR